MVALIAVLLWRLIFGGAPAPDHYGGFQTMAEIEAALKDPVPEKRMKALVAYGLKVEGPDPIVKFLRDDESPKVRATAAGVLGRMRARALDHVDTLIAAMEDPDPVVRRWAFNAVVKIVGRAYAPFDAAAPEDERAEAIAEIRHFWGENKDWVIRYYRERAPKRKTP
ncbi:MAG: HEAT repeat domain-containing protein [Phycisphaerae bacterium]|nr:HEAT repeat domain-containing protein [Phycisphaerae bacterium]